MTDPTPRDAQQPQTEAGKRLWADWYNGVGGIFGSDGDDPFEDIEAIEAEAIAIGAKSERERLRAAVADLHRWQSGTLGYFEVMVRLRDIDALLAEPEAGS